MKELINFVNDPYNDKIIFNLANTYFSLGQMSSALTFYLRVTEYSKNNLLIYESLLKAGLCIQKQGNRINSVKSLFLHAISILPERPEGYFLMTRLYEENKEWGEAYALSSIGEHINNKNKKLPALETDVEYPGEYGFKFEKAVSDWWMGRTIESLNSFLDLDKEPNLKPEHKESIKNNIKRIYGTDDWSEPVYYVKDNIDKLRFKFNKCELIEQNNSQCYQDIFVLSILNGKTNGKYLEIGSYEPFYHSNTAILETLFNWKGISIEIDWNLVSQFRAFRKNNCVCADATKLNYLELLDNANMGTDWDYLQLDCEPSHNTYLALLSIPFEKYRFAVITYEHDHHVDDTKLYKEKSRRYLRAMGYELVVNDISIDGKHSFEDWWVHPELVDKNIINKMKCIDNTIKKINEYIYNNANNIIKHKWVWDLYTNKQ